MVTKFKLVITLDFSTTKRTHSSISGHFVWDSREDALACKALLEKAVIPRYARIKFVEFTEEVPL